MLMSNMWEQRVCKVDVEGIDQRATEDAKCI